MNLSNYSILDLIEHLEFTVEKIVSNNAMIKCPHHAEGKEENASCGVHLDTGLYHCFTCQAKGHITDFLSAEEKESYKAQESGRWNLDLLKDFAQLQRGFFRPEYKTIQEFIQERDKLEFNYEKTYCYLRGVTEEVFNQFYIVETDREVIFPNVNQFGQLISYGVRRIDSKKFYFRTPYDFSVPKISFGEYQVRNEKEITVVEGYFDALRLWSLGYPSIALQGVGSKEQEEYLADSHHRLINICLDNDEAGRKAADKLQQAISHKKYVKKLFAPDPFKDVGEMLDMDIHRHFDIHEIYPNKPIERIW